MIHVFIYHYDAIEKTNLLSLYRIKRLQETTHPIKYLESIAIESLLNKAVSIYNNGILLPLNLDTDSYGKPYIKDGSFYISLSHHHPYYACAISSEPVGIDLEIPRLLSSDLLVYLKSDAPNALLKWTQYEAILKVTGNKKLPYDTLLFKGDTVYVDKHMYHVSSLVDDDFTSSIASFNAHEIAYHIQKK